jgi:hypothetical protein
MYADLDSTQQIWATLLRAAGLFTFLGVVANGGIKHVVTGRFLYDGWESVNTVFSAKCWDAAPNWSNYLALPVISKDSTAVTRGDRRAGMGWEHSGCFPHSLEAGGPIQADTGCAGLPATSRSGATGIGTRGARRWLLPDLRKDDALMFRD